MTSSGRSRAPAAAGVLGPCLGGRERMATDRDEQQRQQQELEEIRRSFAEMGARMGSLFDPAETDEHHGGAPPPVLPPAPPVERRRPGWQLLAAAVVLLLVGTAFGWALSPGGSDSPPPV